MTARVISEASLPGPDTIFERGLAVVLSGLVQAGSAPAEKSFEAAKTVSETH